MVHERNIDQIYIKYPDTNKIGTWILYIYIFYQYFSRVLIHCILDTIHFFIWTFYTVFYFISILDVSSYFIFIMDIYFYFIHFLDTFYYCIRIHDTEKLVKNVQDTVKAVQNFQDTDAVKKLFKAQIKY